LLFVVTIKNEDPVELVLNSTCESSCFLVTKIFNKLVFLLSAIRDCKKKNEKPVEMVLKSTCESSWFFSNKIIQFYLLQSKIVDE